MRTTPPPLRIAIGQLRMRWSGAENTQAILDTIADAAAAGVQLCVFPELALTGFHRQIAALAKPELVEPWLQAIRNACARHAIAVAVGAPSFAGDGRIYNSHVLIDEAGQCVGVVEKSGLTGPEATFFARGAARPVSLLQARRCSAVLCREVEDFEAVCAQLPRGAAELVFWPGLMRPATDTPDADPQRHVKQAQRLAAQLDAFVIQANWPNSLNYPEESEHAGQSVVISPAGRVMLRLPRAQAGWAWFSLGESSYAWHAQEAAASIACG
jgi:omega-amidase